MAKLSDEFNPLEWVVLHDDKEVVLVKASTITRVRLLKGEEDKVRVSFSDKEEAVVKLVDCDAKILALLHAFGVIEVEGEGEHDAGSGSKPVKK